jgi:hypothetical protein
MKYPPVIPAQAGIHNPKPARSSNTFTASGIWIPACAGMTVKRNRP